MKKLDHRRLHSLWKPVLTSAVAITFVATVPPIPAVANPLPTGAVQLGQGVAEPAYNALDGTLAYLLIPNKVPEKANNRTVAPLYLVMYPTSVAGVIGTVSCQHQPMDNCPDHGPGLADLAMTTANDVYGDGVWGHDHLLVAPPAPPLSGGDFSVTWLPVVVLFTNPEAASNHITTLSQLNAALAAGDIETIALPPGTFHGNPVSEATYNQGTPVPPVAP
jgi:hypothetical protein